VTTAPPTPSWREEMKRLNSPPVQFCTTIDGVRIAYIAVGSGPPFIECQNPLATNWQHYWRLPAFRPDDTLLRPNTTYMFDWRNTGLSERTGEPFSIETAVRDLEAVVEVTGEGPVSMRMSVGAAFPVITYAAAHPERIHRLATFNIMIGPQGAAAPDTQYPVAALRGSESGHNVLARVTLGWTEHEKAEQLEDFFASCSGPEYQASCLETFRLLDVRHLVPLIKAPTLVVQRRHLSGRPTVADGAEIASLFPNGRLLVIEGDSWDCKGAEDSVAPAVAFINEGQPSVHLPRASANGSRAGAASDGLSEREREVLALIAAGKTNREIAESLTIADATASRHVHNILEKLGMSRRSEAAAWWASNGNGRAK
jgi:DNA-binding CsgD family transcriptional regulator/pimeloyl-ACP methyl ester carboxylesterase